MTWQWTVVIVKHNHHDLKTMEMIQNQHAIKMIHLITQRTIIMNENVTIKRWAWVGELSLLQICNKHIR